MPGSGASTGSLLPDLASLLRAVRKALLWYPRAFRTTRRSISTKHRGGCSMGFPRMPRDETRWWSTRGGDRIPPRFWRAPSLPRDATPTWGDTPSPPPGVAISDRSAPSQTATPSVCHSTGQIGTLADCDTPGLSLHRTDRHPRRLRHPRFVTPPDRSTPSQTANPSCVRETRHFPGGIPHPPPILACSPSKLKLPRFRGQVSSSSSSRAARRS